MNQSTELLRTLGVDGKTHWCLNLGVQKGRFTIAALLTVLKQMSKMTDNVWIEVARVDRSCVHRSRQSGSQEDRGEEEIGR